MLNAGAVQRLENFCVQTDHRSQASRLHVDRPEHRPKIVDGVLGGFLARQEQQLGARLDEGILELDRFVGRVKRVHDDSATGGWWMRRGCELDDHIGNRFRKFLIGTLIKFVEKQKSEILPA